MSRITRMFRTDKFDSVTKKKNHFHGIQVNGWCPLSNFSVPGFRIFLPMNPGSLTASVLYRRCLSVSVDESTRNPMCIRAEPPPNKACRQMDTSGTNDRRAARRERRLARRLDMDPVYMSRKIRKFRTDKFDTWNKRKFWLMQLM